MAHMPSTYSNIPKVIFREARFVGAKKGEIVLTNFRRSWNSAVHTGRISEKRTVERERGFMVHCCTSSSTSEAGKIGVAENYGDREGQFGYLVGEYGWKVRRMVEEQSEMRKVAQIQAEAFHEPVLLFNDVFFHFFQAEVLSGLLYRLGNSPPDRYACLVAEPNYTDASEELVGVVDVTVLRDEAVLQHLPGANEYLYVSGIAVLNEFRRKKVATTLLKACDMVSVLWGYGYLVLRAYEDDWGALKLYGNAGFTIVAGDSPWTTTWIGRKRRVLMIKPIN
ncbi:Acyl-CoA N-acyltransferase protein [Actinidia chinensis var. chinensis]|uniref:Acyl-CoA N-acyltransferase protein n=1 Tax=Actinidia chinensis var. chinensis TaxID=1590841 RepID=A0A2R6RP64_ACTCC|nr:Acyl-CoA N-acyltransferase protein [Actinidia chinensis var. chinensis]